LNGNYFVQIALNNERKPVAVSSGVVVQLHEAAGVVELQFQTQPPRRKLLPLAHPLVQSLEFFGSAEDAQAFLVAEKLVPAPSAAPAPRSVPKRKPVTLAAVQQDPEPEPELEAEFPEDEDATDAPVEPPPTPPPAPSERERDGARRLARSTVWKVQWKAEDLDDTYVTGVSSSREVKAKIAATFGPQRDSDYLNISRVLPEDVPDDRTVV
jgi:hypothetical protein